MEINEWALVGHAVLVTVFVLFSTWDRINHVFRQRDKKAGEEEKMQMAEGRDENQGI